MEHLRILGRGLVRLLALAAIPFSIIMVITYGSKYVIGFIMTLLFLAIAYVLGMDSNEEN